MESASLRLLHIGFGVFWAAGAIMLGWFVIPAARQAGPSAGPFMQALMGRKLPQLIMGAALITILTGLRLYQIRFSAEWATTVEGMAMSLGLVMGLSAFGIGVLVQRPTAVKVQALSAEIAAGGGPPSAEQGAQMAALQTRMGKTGNALAWHLAVIVVLMAGLRLWQQL